jgi:hypothetical protein
MPANLIFQLTDEEDVDCGTSAASSLHRGDASEHGHSPTATEFSWEDGSRDDRRTSKGSPRPGVSQPSRRAVAVAALAVLGISVISVAMSARHMGRSSAGQRPLVAAAASAMGQGSLPAAAPSPRRGRWPISPRSPVAPSSSHRHRDGHRSPPADRVQQRSASMRSLRRAARPRGVVAAKAAPQPEVAPQVTPPPTPVHASLPVQTEPTRARSVATSASAISTEFSFER